MTAPLPKLPWVATRTTADGQVTTFAAHIFPRSRVLCPTCTAEVGTVDERRGCMVREEHCSWRFQVGAGAIYAERKP